MEVFLLVFVFSYFFRMYLNLYLYLHSKKSKYTSLSSGELFDAIRNDDDEETVVNYLERIDQLYQYIEDALIRMDKLKEALLVTERHKAKKTASLLSLPELVAFDQVERLVDCEHLHALLYFSRVEVSAKINCWLILPAKGVARFHQVSRDVSLELMIGTGV